MRSLTLLSILIASYLANPVVHSGNNLVRRASNRKEEDADIGADIDVKGRDSHYHRGLLGNLYLGELIQKILHFLGLYDYYGYDDDELLDILVDNGGITKEEADQASEDNILGLLRSNHGQGPLNNILDLGIFLASDDEYVKEKEEDLEYQDSDLLGLVISGFEGNHGVKASEDD